MRFKVSDRLNPPTVFLANRSELSDRFDPPMVMFRRRIQEFRYPVHQLRKLLSEPPQYGAAERGIERTSVDQPRYVRITDIDENGFLSKELGVTAFTVEPKYILKENDLLIARSGNTVGKSYLHEVKYAPYDCFYAGYLIRFRLRTSDVLPDYVFAFTQLPYYRKWVEAIRRPAGQPNINAKEFSSLQIPVPSRSVQSIVVKRLNRAYEEKRKKENEADQLLGSIDDLLLMELGIALPVEPPNDIQRRIFKRKYSQIAGKRIDPASNWRRLRLSSSKYPAAKLTRLVKINPISDFEGLLDEDLVSFVPMEAVDDQFGEIAEALSRPVSQAGSYTTFREGDILWAKITPCMENGKAAIATRLQNGKGFGSTEFHVFRLFGNEISVDYLHAVLRLRILRAHARLFFTGSSGHQRVDERFFNDLEIPVPPRPIQNELCRRVAQIREEARRRLSEAQTGLERAKKKIEDTLLA